MGVWHWVGIQIPYFEFIISHLHDSFCITYCRHLFKSVTTYFLKACISLDIKYVLLFVPYAWMCVSDYLLRTYLRAWIYLVKGYTHSKVWQRLPRCFSRKYVWIFTLIKSRKRAVIPHLPLSWTETCLCQSHGYKYYLSVALKSELM